MNLTAALTVYRSPDRVEGLSIVLVDEARGSAATLFDSRAPTVKLLPEVRPIRDAVRGLRDTAGDTKLVLDVLTAAFALVDAVAPGAVIAVRTCDAEAPIDLPSASAIRHQHRAWTVIEFLQAAVL